MKREVMLLLSVMLSMLTAFAQGDVTNYRSQPLTHNSRLISGFHFGLDDRLIQLCDALGAAEGFVRLEIRLFDVAIRNGINEYTIEKWKKFLELKRYFDEKCNIDIYKLLNIE